MRALLLGLSVGAFGTGLNGIRTRPGGVSDLLLLMKLLRRLFVALVFEQARDEHRPRVFRLFVLGAVFVRRRQQHLRLDVDECRRHHQELTGEIQVELLHELENLEVTAW